MKIRKLPLIGYGTWGITQKTNGVECIYNALKVGYKNIDTAQVYNNEYEVGQAIKKSKIDRDSVFITTKIFPLNYKYHVYSSLKESLRRLQIKKADLILLHFPLLDKDINVMAYKELMKARKEGLTTNIGVSNWDIDNLKYLYKKVKEYPYANEIIVSPIQRAEDLEKFCKEKKINLIGYSTIRCYTAPNVLYGRKKQQNVLTTKQKENIDIIAKKHKTSFASVLLKWSIDKGYHIIPKSQKLSRIKTNFEINNIKLSPKEIAIIDEMNNFSNNTMVSIWNLSFLNFSNKQFKKGLLFDKHFKLRNLLTIKLIWTLIISFLSKK